MAKDKRDPNITSPAYDIMLPRWTMIDTLLGGTEAMRNAAMDYLPQHAAETNEDYIVRLGYATLENFLEQTLEHLSAKPFAEPMAPNDDVPEPIVENILPDVDLRGNDLNVFAQSCFRMGLAKGYSVVLVDHPRRKPRADGKPRTLDDDRRENLRPYWTLIDPVNIIFAHAEIVDGKEQLLHVRIRETYQEMDGYNLVERQQIRVLEPGKVSILRPGSGKRKNDWVVHEEWETGLNKVPLVVFYTSRDDTMLCKPPLLDLAYLNVAHWQSTADQRHVMKVARFPMLAVSGASSTDDSVKVAPNQLLSTTDPQGKYYYVEHSGAAIEAGRKELMDLSDAARAYGAEFLRKKPGNETATRRALDGSESISALQAYVMLFVDAVAQMLDLTAEWMHLNDGVGGTVTMNLDLSAEDAQLDSKPLLDLRRQRDLSRHSLLTLLVRQGVLPEDFDVEGEEQLLQDEFELAASLDIDPAAPHEKPKGEDAEDEE